MTAHVPSDNDAIRAADDLKTVNAHRALDEAVAWLKHTPSWAALQTVQDRALAVFLDRVRVLEALTRPAPSVNDSAVSLTRAANAAPIIPASNGERPSPRVVPRRPREADYR